MPHLSSPLFFISGTSYQDLRSDRPTANPNTGYQSDGIHKRQNNRNYKCSALAGRNQNKTYSQEQSYRIYTVLNGDYPSSFFSQGEPVPKDFQDEELRSLYGAAYASTDLENVLKVIRSELTGEKAFEDSE